jgi:hypothetical protein
VTPPLNAPFPWFGGKRLVLACLPVVEATGVVRVTTLDAHARWTEYQAGLRERAPTQARVVADLWDRVVATAPSAAAPTVWLGDGGELTLAWGDEHESLAVDVLPDGMVEWFWYDKRTCGGYGSEMPTKELCLQIVERASRFVTTMGCAR